VTSVGPQDPPSGARADHDVRARALSLRALVDWEARYRDRLGTLWLRCRVLDISTQGAGMLLVEETTDPLDAIVLELKTPGRTNTHLLLSGQVRHSSVTDGRRRIGVEFVDLAPSDERALREVLARRLALDE